MITDGLTIQELVDRIVRQNNQIFKLPGKLTIKPDLSPEYIIRPTETTITIKINLTYDDTEVRQGPRFQSRKTFNDQIASFCNVIQSELRDNRTYCPAITVKAGDGHQLPNGALGREIVVTEIIYERVLA